jgi:hypothetical protein
MIILFFWLVFTIIVAVMGSQRKIGVVLAFLAAFFLSPLIGFIIVIMSPTIEEEKRKNETIIHQRKQSEILRNLSDIKENQTNKTSLVVDLEKINSMKDAGLLTEEEYQTAKYKLLNS